MRAASTPLLALLALATPALAQTDVLYSIPRPAGELQSWATTMVRVPDLDGDGVGELALAGRHHGGGTTRLYSGADGSPLFEIVQDFHVLFFGRGIAGIGDQTGDGVPEIAVVGFRSGDASSPEGRLHVYSGADGSVVRELLAPPGVSLREGKILAVDDADGDGVEDILVRSFGPARSNSLELFSSRTGALLYADGAGGPGALGSDPVRTNDHDGDGNADFLVAVSLGHPDGRELQVRSGRTGEILSTLDDAALDVFTGNGEPLVRLPDRDGDGLDDLAVGGVFEGFVGAFSSADATLLQEWTSPDPFGIGSLLIQAGDLNGDGLADLVALEVQFEDGLGSPSESSLVGLDIETGSTIFREPVEGIETGYGVADVILALPGIDPRGAPTFAISDPLADEVSVRRFVPRRPGPGARPRGARSVPSGTAPPPGR